MARVLLVEDDAVTALYYRQLLADAGHAVSVCADGDDAIDECALAAPDLIVTDYRMPKTDGAAFIAWIRASAHADLPIILITGARREELPVAIGSDLLLSKPFRDQDLLRTVEIILAKAARRPAGALI
jgi:CheY-like chemotaxis protein